MKEEKESYTSTRRNLMRRTVLSLTGITGAAAAKNYSTKSKTNGEIEESTDEAIQTVEQYLSTHGINEDNYDTNTATLTVEDRDFDLSKYINNNDEVDTQGLQKAINDFVESEIGTGDLQTVINEFLASQ